ncbi:HNH endonuclease [Corynebacterium qintianiae]|uniref:HNH endonuclease n=1 Tax=Corynebacterium qintianiae TaxID=2709392 RepID=UPI0013ED883D|nr:HNH endonuclease [Corynebacterium qintianiae]
MRTGRVRLWTHRFLTGSLVTAIVASTSQADAIAQDEAQRLSEEITASAEARSFAVSMLDSAFPASREAAVDALNGSERNWSNYVDTGREIAQQQDLRSIMSTLSSVSGPTVQDRANELLTSGTTEQMGEFIESGWQQAQAQDDRATAWEAAEAPEGSTLKAAADEALRINTPDALAEFAATGQETARAHDRRREVYELTNSPLPTVAANAAEALQVGTDTAIEGFLRYGQFVAATQDAEKMDISQLVEMAITEAETATNENNKAWTQADRAARAAEAARIATEKSRDEALAADAAQNRAGNAAIAAGNLATQSAHVADQAVAASQEARQALRQTADALSRAASASARAQAAAAAAASAANAAAYDAGSAAAARRAAEQARNAAQAAQRSAEAYNYASQAAGYAQSAGRAAGSAAANADAAATAATNAANAAGVSEAAAAEARAGAARARNAANQVDSLVVQIQGLVEEAKTAARDAADHARRAADAADAAAREAGNARYAATFAGQHAQAAADAADKARRNTDLAVKTHQIANVSADQRLEEERAFLKDQALAARDVQDAQDNAAAEERKRRDDLTARMEALTRSLPDSEDSFAPTDQSLGDIRQLALAAAQVGSPAVAGAAKVALEGNTDDDLIDFAFYSYPDAVATDDLNEVSYIALYDPDENIRAAADEMGYEDDTTIARFLNDELPQMRLPGLITQTWQLRESAGPATQAAADEALRTNTFDALNTFVNGGGYEQARYTDQLQEAYALTESGGKEVAIAAEAAVTGDRAGLNEFITIEQYRRAMYNHQRDAHNADIDALLELGKNAALTASQQAAQAQEAHQRALGSAAQADQYAQQAQQWAGQAQQSAQLAQTHVDSAQQALTFAKQQQQRAHDAAASAEADAAQATDNADQATAYAATARTAANNAAASASAARQSANAASHDAVAASQAANDAYNAAWQLELSELEQARSAAAEGLITTETQSALDKIRNAIGKENLDLILDLIGVNDVLRCFRGQVSGCIWAAVGVVPIGKAAKIAKAMPAIRRLIAKTGDIKHAFQYSRVKAALDDALIPAACRVAGTVAYAAGTPTYTPAIYRPATQIANPYTRAASRCPYPPSVQKVNGRYPINARYAGGVWRDGDPAKMPKGWPYDDIHFSDRGFPIFNQHIHEHPTKGFGDIELDHPTGSSWKDIREADDQFGIDAKYRREHNLVWHHHEDTGRMQLIPRDLHNAVRHTGGYAMWSKPLNS